MRLLGRMEPGSGSGIFTGHSESREGSAVRSESRRVESLAVLSAVGGRRTGGMVSCAATRAVSATSSDAVSRRRGNMLRMYSERTVTQATLLKIRVPHKQRGLDEGPGDLLPPYR